MKDKRYLFFLIFAALSFLFFTHPSYFSLKIDDFATQLFYALQGHKFNPKDLVVVEIDEDTLNKIESQWPFGRAFYSQALNRLQDSPPKAVGFDIVFAGRSDAEKKDVQFAHALQNFQSPVVLAYFLDREGKPVYPYIEFKKSADVGFVNVSADRDRVVRSARGYFETERFSDFSWAAKIASYFHQAFPQKEKSMLKVGEGGIFLNRQGSFPINYLLKPADFDSISFYRLLAGDFEPDFFSEKVVLFGSVLDITHDIHSTPLGIMPGVYIQANIIFDLIQGRIIRRLPFIFNIFILLVTFFAIAYLFFNYTFLRGLFLSLGVLLLLFWLDYGLRVSGFQLAYGRIAVSSFAFIVLSNFYTYAAFLKSISRVKNHAVVNPITGLFNVRYFLERLFFDLRRIPKIPRYLAIIYLQDFSTKSANLDFSEVKAFWEGLSQTLSLHSKLWCNYSEEVILGEILNPKKANFIKNEIQAFLYERKIDSNVKIGTLRAEDRILHKSVIFSLLKDLDKQKSDVITFSSKDLPYGQKKPKLFDFLTSLYSDTEERNQELLLTVKKLKNEEKKTRKAYLQLIHSLVAALESKDPYTQGHTDRVCQYALLLADKLSLSEVEKEKIRKASLLHDLGKIGISDFILHKKGQLTEAEFDKIKEHQTTSARILKPIEEFSDIIPYILYHHENFDGTGYPHCLAGNFIPLGARIIAVADVFDALITGRDYKEAFSPQKSVEILISMKNKRLDPELVDIFIEAIKDEKII